jgi:hypothetical protein
MMSFSHFKNYQHAISRLPAGEWHVTLIHIPTRRLVAGIGRTKAAAKRQAASKIDPSFYREADYVPPRTNVGPFWGCI